MRIEVPFKSQGLSKPHVNITRPPLHRVVKMPSGSEVLAAMSIQRGREAWTYLHTTDDDPETAIVNFEAMIPSYGCTCKSDYAKIKEQHPFDCSSPDAFFVSGVNLHNAVNRKLGKPELSLEEARKIWNRLAPME